MGHYTKKACIKTSKGYLNLIKWFNSWTDLDVLNLIVSNLLITEAVKRIFLGSHPSFIQCLLIFSSWRPLRIIHIASDLWLNTQFGFDGRISNFLLTFFSCSFHLVTVCNWKHVGGPHATLNAMGNWHGVIVDRKFCSYVALDVCNLNFCNCKF